MKKVEFNGITYKIEFSEYGYSSSLFRVNGEATSFWINNNRLDNIESFKEEAKKAIIEYTEKKKAQQLFKDWDGVL
jgi:hypothetical protein